MCHKPTLLWAMHQSIYERRNVLSTLLLMCMWNNISHLLFGVFFVCRQQQTNPTVLRSRKQKPSWSPSWCLWSTWWFHFSTPSSTNLRFIPASAGRSTLWLSGWKPFCIFSGHNLIEARSLRRKTKRLEKYYYSLTNRKIWLHSSAAPLYFCR